MEERGGGGGGGKRAGDAGEEREMINRTSAKTL